MRTGNNLNNFDIIPEDDKSKPPQIRIVSSEPELNVDHNVNRIVAGSESQVTHTMPSSVEIDALMVNVVIAGSESEITHTMPVSTENQEQQVVPNADTSPPESESEFIW